jgi:hypothetical protein
VELFGGFEAEGLELIAGAGEVPTQEFGVILVVFDDEDAQRGGAGLSADGGVGEVLGRRD